MPKLTVSPPKADGSVLIEIEMSAKDWKILVDRGPGILKEFVASGVRSHLGRAGRIWVEPVSARDQERLERKEG